ncbi:MAG: RagB/SusD family nutrient uptake outer membrane protein [Bacteroidetes bacterium]|nr:RagB/SusD family nutrient uptake outer membrane protein [Bacteroidota bacterium]
MKKFNLYLSTLILGILILNGCSKEFLNVEPKGTTLETNYYKNAEEAFNGLVSCYDPLGTECWGKDVYACKVGALNSASDDCYAGGGSSSDVPTWQVWNNYTIDAAIGIQAAFWGRNFTGVYRVNTLLSKLPNVSMSDTLKARFIAECKFLRAFYYFDLVRLFKNVPLFTAPLLPSEFFKVTQASPQAVYAQVEKDLNEAIVDLPVQVVAAENGRVTKMAALALLGKVILFQNDEARMIEAADLFEQVNSSPNYALLADFGLIFRPDNKFNSESIFEIVHTSKAMSGWESWPNFEGSIYTQMCGPRAYTGPTYVASWGFNPITLDLVTLMKNDPRYKYTIVNIDSMKTAGLCNYEKGYQNTGYFVAKYAPLLEFRTQIGGDPMLNYPNDIMEIRLADTYLMEAEALVRGGGNIGRAQDYLDRVRARVGLPSIPATLDNIYKERRLELATEGHRWFDLVRTGQAATVLAGKGFKPNKNEILPIPLAELSNTMLVQNPGY